MPQPSDGQAGRIAFRIKQIIDLLTPEGVQRMRGLEDGDELDINGAVGDVLAVLNHSFHLDQIQIKTHLDHRLPMGMMRRGWQPCS